MSENINLLFREGMNEKISEIKKENPNAKFYSISRLNNFNQCKRGYYYTYIDKKEQKSGVYSTLGSAAHSDLEDLYEGKVDELLPQHFNEEWIKCELFGIKFPSNKIKENYKKDLDAFYKIYKKDQGKYISELGFILQIDNNSYIMGYIDLLQIHDDGSVSISDFKTSSAFATPKKLQHAGRQLCLYQLSMEQLYGLKVVSNEWIMLKYVEVQIGNNKPKIVSTREWVSKCESQLKTLMKKSGMDSFLIDMYLLEAKKNNNVEGLPEEIKSKVFVKIQCRKYEITEEIRQETLLYVKETINAIENMEKDIEKWDCSVDKFFCQHLCGFYPKNCNPI